MANSTEISPGNVARQCEYLRVLADKLAQTSGWVMWSYDRDEYFNQLRDYCALHSEMKVFLSAHRAGDQLIMDRVNELPDIEFKDYSRESLGWRTFVTVILLYVFFPLAYLWLFSAISYVNRTRQHLYQAGGLYSSIAFLIRAANN